MRIVGLFPSKVKVTVNSGMELEIDDFILRFTDKDIENNEEDFKKLSFYIDAVLQDKDLRNRETIKDTPKKYKE